MQDGKIGIHQPNFVPWLPFFYKMAMCDTFILLTHVQFEKNGYQNRFWHKDQWVTKPVKSGLEKISDKYYTDGTKLSSLNRQWIQVIAKTLDIKTFVYEDDLCSEGRSDDPTMRLVELVKQHRGNTYITNHTAKDKYLDESKFDKSGIGIEYCKVPKHLKMSIFEAMEVYGIEGIKKQLPRREKTSSLG